MRLPIELNLWQSLALLFVFLLALQFGAELLCTATGRVLVGVMSRGRIRVGISRYVFSPPPKSPSTWYGYHEDAQAFIYRNVASLLGLAFWMTLLVIFWMWQAWR